MSTIHAGLGFALVGGLFVLFLWGLVAWLAKRGPTEWYWRLLAVLQVLLILQALAGVVLLLLGRSQPFLHYFYGAVFPAVVLAVAHGLGRGMESERDSLVVFVVASFVAFGLTLRALATGLGIG